MKVASRGRYCHAMITERYDIRTILAEPDATCVKHILTFA